MARIETVIQHVYHADGSPTDCTGCWMLHETPEGLLGVCNKCGEERPGLGHDLEAAASALAGERFAKDL